MSLGCDGETTCNDRERGDRDLSQLQLAGVPREHIPSLRPSLRAMKLTTRVLSETLSTLAGMVSYTFECLVHRIAIGDAL